MKEFKCGAIVPGCPTVLHGESEQEILASVRTHAQDTHGMYEVPPEVDDAIRANITELPPA